MFHLALKKVVLNSFKVIFTDLTPQILIPKPVLHPQCNLFFCFPTKQRKPHYLATKMFFHMQTSFSKELVQIFNFLKGRNNFSRLDFILGFVVRNRQKHECKSSHTYLFLVYYVKKVKPLFSRPKAWEKDRFKVKIPSPPPFLSSLCSYRTSRSIIAGAFCGSHFCNIKLCNSA